MLLGVLSDTHNNLTALQNALTLFRQRGIDTLVHCGDLTTPETASAMGGFRVIHVVGNGDYLSGEIRQALLYQNPQSFSGLVFRGEVDGVKIGAAHGHIAGQVQELLGSEECGFVFTGHSHRRRDEQVGWARLINPGALGGLRSEDRSVYVLDLQTGEGIFLPV
jgi:uncharacterized protein